MGKKKASSEELQSIPQFPKKGDFIEGRHRYRIIEKLGSGGFGSVFRAEALQVEGEGAEFPAEVALKFFLADTEENQLLVAKRELAALQVLSSDRIPRLLDWSLQPSNVFLATDYYPAGSLQQRIKSRDQPAEAEIWRLLGDLLKAIKLAHRRAILHLDIKPDNVLLGAQGGFFLTDFGISKATLHDEGANHIAAGGTEGYHSPEQFSYDLDMLDTQTDLFGIGATAWAFATGVDLSKKRHLVKMDNAGTALPALAKYRPDLSPDLGALLAELTTVDADQRPGGAAEVLTRVQAFGAQTGDVWEPVEEEEARALASELVEPLWVSLAQKTDLLDRLVRFESGTVLTRENEEAFEAFLLLKGVVLITHNGEILGRETREGSMIGEIATLTGTRRTATAICEGPVYACVYNAAELERFLIRHPSVTLRLLKDASDRMIRERARNTG